MLELGSAAVAGCLKPTLLQCAAGHTSSSCFFHSYAVAASNAAEGPVVDCAGMVQFINFSLFQSGAIGKLDVDLSKQLLLRLTNCIMLSQPEVWHGKHHIR